jgi:hypothetical protein
MRPLQMNFQHIPMKKKLFTVIEKTNKWSHLVPTKHTHSKKKTTNLSK